MHVITSVTFHHFWTPRNSLPFHNSSSLGFLWRFSGSCVVYGGEDVMLGVI